MILREFGLGASRSQFPRDIASEFEFQVRCVTSLFGRCWEKADMGTGTWKLYVEMVEEVERDRVLVGDLVQTQARGDVRGFFDLEPRRKKEQALEWLMEGIARITQECGWDPAPFDRAAARVKELDYANEWVWKKPKSNRPRTLKAEVVVNHGIDAATLTMQVRDKAGVIVRRKTFASEKPDELIFKRHLGELRWLDEKTVALLPQYGEGRVEVTVD